MRLVNYNLKVSLVSKSLTVVIFTSNFALQCFDNLFYYEQFQYFYFE